MNDGFGRLRDISIRLVRRAQRGINFLFGVVFLLFAVASGAQSYLEWRRYSEHPAAGFRDFAMIALFTVLLMILSLYSFLKARSVK